MNTGDTVFTVYWLALIASGIIMLAIAGTGFGGLSTGERAINAVFGIGFLGYGIYLGFVFDGGSYLMFFKAFIVPVLLIINAVRHAAKRKQPVAAQAPPMQGYPTQPYANLAAPANTIGQQPTVPPQPQPPAGTPQQSPVQPG